MLAFLSYEKLRPITSRIIFYLFLVIRHQTYKFLVLMDLDGVDMILIPELWFSLGTHYNWLGLIRTRDIECVYM